MRNDDETDDKKERAREVLRGWFDKPIVRMPPEVVAQLKAYIGVWIKAWDRMSVAARIRLVSLSDSPDELTPDEMQRLFDERVAIQDSLERHFWESTTPGGRNQLIYDEVTLRQANGERGAYQEVALEYDISPKTVRNICGAIRRSLAVAKRPPKKSIPK